MSATKRAPEVELEILRISVARIAQVLGDVEFDGKPLDGMPFQTLQHLARIENRGWNRLAGDIVERVVELKRLNESLSDDLNERIRDVYFSI